MVRKFLLFFLIFFSFTPLSRALSQAVSPWLPAQRIPGYEAETWPPLLLADGNKTVHAFSYQWLDDSGGVGGRAIHYNKWVSDQGWTAPIDILLSPLKFDARLLDVYLDNSGTVHLIFWAGDNTEANIYYSSAQIEDAGDAKAWSIPNLVAMNVQDPENGVIFSPDQNNLVVVFSGKSQGNGLYMSVSEDRGLTWSEPSLIFNTRDLDNFVNELKKFVSNTGIVHLIWNEVNEGGQGRNIFYSSTEIQDLGWSNPVKIAEAESGYGTNTPAIIEYSGQRIAFYNLGGTIYQRTSNDGVTWTAPAKLFSRHVGVNGSLSLVVDQNDQLHILFGQRITGAPDIHGIWHSIYDGTVWSEPEPVVSGPQVTDMEGDKAFDPFEARATVSQDNVLLVTWRMDPGMKGNGVWYSYKNLGQSESPALSPEASAVPEVNSGATLTSTESLQSTQQAGSLFVDGPADVGSPSSISNPISTVLIGIIPVVVLLALFLIVPFVWLKRG